MVKGKQKISRPPFSSKNKLTEVSVVRPPYKVLSIWKAPARPYKKRNREYFTTVGAIVFLLAVIFLFLKEWLLIGAIVSLAFLSYVLASIPPEEIEYKLTNRGIVIADKTYFWTRLGRFWFSEKWDSPIIHIEHGGLPTQLLLVYNEKKVSKKNLKEILDRYLAYDKPEKTPIDKAAKWLQEKFPLESKATS